MEKWRPINGFSAYEVSNWGNVRRKASERLLSPKRGLSGAMSVGLMRAGVQNHKSIPLLVASEFIEQPSGTFDTPINLDGDRNNNSVENLAWRPRWFAVAYNRQFKEPYFAPIEEAIQEIKTGSVFPNSFSVATTFGLLEKDVVLSILNKTFTWPTFQRFEVN